MGFLEDLAAPVSLPPLYRVEQHFDRSRVANIGLAVTSQLEGYTDLGHIKGERVGVALGSRGVASIDQVAGVVVKWLHARGASPFILPAMGSHGGATPAGQRAVLAQLGITEHSMGAPILDSMAVRILDEVFGAPVYWSEEALHMDRLIVVNRIKLHTAFRAARESGVTKMMVIGLGKREGAETLHGLGPQRFPDTIPAFAAAIMRQAPPIVGLGLVENAYHQICHVEALPASELARREAELLAAADADTAVKLAIKTSTTDAARVELIRIRNTMHLSSILVTESVLARLEGDGQTTVSEGPVEFWSPLDG